MISFRYPTGRIEPIIQDARSLVPATPNSTVEVQRTQQLLTLKGPPGPLLGRRCSWHRCSCDPEGCCSWHLLNIPFPDRMAAGTEEMTALDEVVDCLCFQLEGKGDR